MIEGIIIKFEIMNPTTQTHRMVNSGLKTYNSLLTNGNPSRLQTFML